ncbi:NGO_0222 family membrane protein [Alysiella filiformis]|uniref:Uncharacterized protein n=1 Tax=Alysiella filiformis DSM 16848 TaxID=1120981 RepID=A0A286EJ71_9NEIS|nr:NGO_0222 family membrane protein [Alysiella filiformis]QMT30720.1 hypothetical protein H3L97_08200 [Alysiella filiformis]UBQ56301.1 hypothetical protein JF568_00485 [Alysiella filiformis DSM 16848]SOD70958.1 hypothetical protein SAMN02746062_02106 [Alysiella filiformis DSM 16848]
MSKRQTFLILIILFSLLFVALIALGSYWLSLKTLPERQFGIAAFLFAFAAAFGQIGSLAMYIRHIAREKAQRQMMNQNNEL